MRRALVRLVRSFIDRPVRLVGALLGALVVVAALTLLPPLVLSALPGLVPTLARPPEPRATEDFMRGNREYDANLVWSSLAEDARTSMAGAGGDAAPAAMQAQMQAARDRGYRLEDISYIGGKSLPDGTSMQFYLVGYRPSAQADVEYVPFLFTLDKSGKIAKVQ